MSRAFSIKTIFETRGRYDPKLAVYPTVASHLNAARAGKKGLSLFGFPLGYMMDGGPEYLNLLKHAFERGLVVVLQCNLIPGFSFERQEPNVFVARPEELWRIPAWLALWETAFVDKTPSLAREAQQSLLLGYTKKQRAAWIENLRQRYSAYGHPGYLLLDRAQRRRVVDLGMRCLGSPAEIEGMQVYFDRNAWGVKPNTFRRLPAGVTLARIGVPGTLFRDVFGHYSTWKRRTVIEGRLSKRVAKLLSRSQRSNVQFLTARGWA